MAPTIPMQPRSAGAFGAKPKQPARHPRLPTTALAAEKLRAHRLFEERYSAHVRRIDRLLAYVMLAQWVLGVLLAAFVSPYAWSAKTHVFHGHLLVALVLGTLVTAPPVALAFLRPGRAVTRTVMACAQMLWSALLIHLTGGRIEAHFHVFGSLAILAFYRDWRIFVPATAVVVADHVIRQVLWPESVFGVVAPEWWRSLEHAVWIVFEEVFLTIACIGGLEEMKRAAAQQTHIEFTERLEKEMEIAARIQTSILPRSTAVKGLEVAARMLTATEVGGDYYEILPVDGGCWIGIGDVAGHGLKAGLVMLQAQSAIEALVRCDPNANPRDILASVNAVLFENVRKRLRSDEHVTMSLMRWHDDGRLVSAGAHEEALIWRTDTRRCERVPVEGTWLGAVADIRRTTVDRTHYLKPNDLLVLYTDGVTEARNAAREMFGLDRLAAVIEQHAREPVDKIRDRVLAAVADWSGENQDDDVTLLVFRHHGVAQQSAAE